VLPRSTSPESSVAWSRGVQLRSRRPAFGVSKRTLSPQLVRPSKWPFPVATSRFPVAGSTTTPARAQIAAPLWPQVRGTSSTCRLLQSAFQTWAMRPVRG
jgi:hypothetical protein